MHLAELIFFGCFTIFVIAILLLDTLVIDKKAHEVSMKEAGIWTAVWIILALLFSVFLWFHGDLVHGINNFSDLQAVTTKYASHIKLNPGDFEWSLQQYRHHMTISYISGYLLEKTLSVDNLFVMMMIFTSFGVSKKEYQHVLNWGIFGAIVLRCIFIFLGSAFVTRFSWLLTVFGLFLVYSGFKMFFEKKKDEKVDVVAIFLFLEKHLCDHPRHILYHHRPLRGVLLQHLCDPWLASHVLPLGRCSRQVLALETRSFIPPALHRYQAPHPRLRRDRCRLVVGIHSLSPRSQHRWLISG